MENLKEFWLKEPQLCNIQYCPPHLTTSHSEIYNVNSSAAFLLAAAREWKYIINSKKLNHLFEYSIISRVDFEQLLPLGFSFEWFWILQCQWVSPDGLKLFIWAKTRKIIDTKEWCSVGCCIPFCVIIFTWWIKRWFSQTKAWVCFEDINWFDLCLALLGFYQSILSWYDIKTVSKLN